MLPVVKVLLLPGTGDRLILYKFLKYTIEIICIFEMPVDSSIHPVPIKELKLQQAMPMAIPLIFRIEYVEFLLIFRRAILK